jgi:hypothetical protein
VPCQAPWVRARDLKSWRERSAVVLGGLVAAASVTGCLSACGAPSSTTTAVSSTALAFQTAATDGDGAGICDLLTDSLTKALEHSGQSCSSAVTALQLGDPGAVLATDVWGRSALVTFADTSSDVFLTEVNGTWRIAAAGCAVRDSRPAECQLEAG